MENSLKLLLTIPFSTSSILCLHHFATVANCLATSVSRNVAFRVTVCNASFKNLFSAMLCNNIDDEVSPKRPVDISFYVSIKICNLLKMQ